MTGLRTLRTVGGQVLTTPVRVALLDRSGTGTGTGTTLWLSGGATENVAAVEEVTLTFRFQPQHLINH